MSGNIEYTAVIRTLGTAREKYQILLNSLAAQTIQPQAIIVYIAEGYPLPKETVGIERYVYVKKGMVAQRALPYDEVQTEYILFLDDDLYIPSDFVSNMYSAIVKNNADVISPDIYHNDKRPLKAELMMLISGRMCARRSDKKWGYKVMRNSGYSYNKNPEKVLQSQTNAGSCFFCSKETFLSINFQDELWLDNLIYAIGDDQTMYYKMYLSGLKVLTIYDTGIVHLDAGYNIGNKQKEQKLIYSDFWFKTIFWHRFIYLPERNILFKFWDICSIVYTLLFTLLISLLKGDFTLFKLKWDAIIDGISFINSKEYKTLPLIHKK